MGAKHWIIFVIVVVAIIGGMVYMSMQNRLDVGDISAEQAASIMKGEDRNGNIGDHVLGNKDAKVVLIEYGDFQCPGCKSMAPTLKDIATKYEDSLAVVYRNFPLTASHPNARAAAASAEAAGLQGKYWEMLDLLFAQQDSWAAADVSQRNDIFTSYARELGLDTDKFAEDTASQEVAKKIDFDVALAKKSNVVGTPTFIINGETIDYRSSDNGLEDAVKEALKEAGVKLEETSEK